MSVGLGACLELCLLSCVEGGQQGRVWHVRRRPHLAYSLDSPPPILPFVSQCCSYVINLSLREGSAYFMRIYALNGAGLEGYR